MIDTLLIDFDGVLTDGVKSIDHTGRTMFKHTNSKDTRAIREIIAHGIRVIIVTADKSEINKTYAEKVGAELIVERDKSKLPFETFGTFWAVGDDAWDLVMLEKAQKAFVPKEFDRSLKKIMFLNVLETMPGKGVIAELIWQIDFESQKPKRKDHLILERR